MSLKKYKAVEVKNEAHRLFNSLTEYGKFIKIGNQLVTNFKGKAEQEQITAESASSYLKDSLKAIITELPNKIICFPFLWIYKSISLHLLCCRNFPCS